MNRDELLTKLAMELAEWPTIQTEWNHLKFRYDMMDDLVIPLDRAWDEVITERDWLQRRAALINKPSWDDAPEWAEWLAQDADGEWRGFREEPRVGPNGDHWFTMAPIAGIVICEGALPAGHDWRQTLERRPQRELNPTTSSLTHSQAVESARETGLCSDGHPCGKAPNRGDDDYCIGCPNEPAPCGSDTDACITNPCGKCDSQAYDCPRCGGEYWSPPHHYCPCQDEIGIDGKQSRYQDDEGDDWIDEFARTSTVEEFRGAMRFTIGKYNRRMGKKDEVVKEIRKMRDYCDRWLAYEVEQ